MDGNKNTFACPHPLSFRLSFTSPFTALLPPPSSPGVLQAVWGMGVAVKIICFVTPSPSCSLLLQCGTPPIEDSPLLRDILSTGCSSSRTAPACVLAMSYSPSGIDCSSVSLPRGHGFCQKTIHELLSMSMALAEACYDKGSPWAASSLGTFPSPAAWGPQQAAEWISAPTWLSPWNSCGKSASGHPSAGAARETLLWYLEYLLLMLLWSRCRFVSNLFITSLSNSCCVAAFLPLLKYVL